MNKIKYIIVIVLFLVLCVSGYLFGVKFKDNNKKIKKQDNEIVINGIRESFDNINVRPNDGEISDVRLVCQNGMRYLYAFHYKYENRDLDIKEMEDDFAIEMIIDTDTNFYFIESLENYENRFDNKCLNLYE